MWRFQFQRKIVRLAFSSESCLRNVPKTGACKLSISVYKETGLLFFLDTTIRPTCVLLTAVLVGVFRIEICVHLMTFHLIQVLFVKIVSTGIFSLQTVATWLSFYYFLILLTWNYSVGLHCSNKLLLQVSQRLLLVWNLTWYLFKQFDWKMSILYGPPGDLAIRLFNYFIIILIEIVRFSFFKKVVGRYMVPTL